MATKSQLSQNAISTRRGVSAKGRKEAAIKEQREAAALLGATPKKDSPAHGASQTSPNEAGAATGMGQTKNLLQKRQKKPAYMQSLNEHEKAENFKIIDNMNKKISYLKNPRFTVNKGPILFTQVTITDT